VAIALALANDPPVILADEPPPTSTTGDVSVHGLRRLPPERVVVVVPEPDRAHRRGRLRWAPTLGAPGSRR